MADRYFDLSIRMANAGMQTDGDIAAALREVADLLADGDDGERSNPTSYPADVRDVNGHKVGEWRVVDSRRSTEGYR
ncbi:hypothetical protein SEA_FIZZLES_91 [Microbacterium phage Fizzles]|nr:hypothetical protein SEA_FIZZLES_91 [Microbacterium phage Fizzles]